MISERLRPIFAEELPPLFIRHLVYGLTLLPITMIRTGWGEFAFFLLLFGLQLETANTLGAFFLLSLVSITPVVLFLAWSLPGADRGGLPKRSIGALCLLIAYHPARLHLEGVLSSEDPIGNVEEIHERFPMVWAFKHFDTPLLLGLIVWAILRHQTAKPRERILFHWLLFLCALWAACALNDTSVGLMLDILASPG
jgi:hypothetical protein